MSDRRIFTNQDLYTIHSDGQAYIFPQDIKQDNIGNCYYLAALQALAQRHPRHIADMIRFDAEKQDFSVRFYNEKTEKYDLVYRVNQDDIWENIRRKGASHLDNGNIDAPLWPAIMEIAFVKKKASDEGGLSMNDAYNLVGAGGKLHASIDNLTGFKSGYMRIPEDFKENFEREFDDFMKEANDKDGIALLAIKKSPSKIIYQLIPGHAYSIDHVGINADGQKYLALRNPLNFNRPSPGETGPLNPDDPSFIAIDFESMLVTDGWWALTTPGEKIVPVNAPSAIKNPEAKQQNANDLLHHLMRQLDSPKQPNPLQGFIDSLNEKSLAPFTQGDTTTKEAAIVPHSLQALQPETSLNPVHRR